MIELKTEEDIGVLVWISLLILIACLWGVRDALLVLLIGVSVGGVYRIILSFFD